MCIKQVVTYVPVLLVFSMEDPDPLTQSATTTSTQSWIRHILVFAPFFVKLHWQVDWATGTHHTVYSAVSINTVFNNTRWYGAD